MFQNLDVKLLYSYIAVRNKIWVLLTKQESLKVTLSPFSSEFIKTFSQISDFFLKTVFFENVLFLNSDVKPLNSYINLSYEIREKKSEW